MSNPMNPDEQLANYIDGLVPAISLEDITRMSRSEITVLPTSLEGEQNTMNEYHEYPSSPDSLPEIALIDRAAAKRRNRVSLWAGGAVAAAAAVAVIGYMFSGTDPAKTTTNTDSTAASEFTESDGNGVPDGSDDAGSSEVASSTDMANGFVVRASDGSFINYIGTYDMATGAVGETTAMRSTDGENWESVDLSGLPQGHLAGVYEKNDQLIAMVSDFDMTNLAGNPKSALAVSTDGTNWITLSSPEPAASSQGAKSQVDPSDAARLADGRYLVTGMQYSSVDLEALGIDESNVCGSGVAYLDSGEEAMVKGAIPTTETWEITFCDGTTQTIEVPPIDMSGSTMLWTVDADGTNPTPVSAPRPGLTPSYDPLLSIDGVVIAIFNSEDNPEMTVLAKTSDATTWETQDQPGGSGFAGGHTVGYNGTTYRTATPNDGTGAMRVERSNDGGNTWTATAPLGDKDSIQFIAAGPAGVVAVANYDDMELPSFNYVADDGTHLSGEIPTTTTTWVLTTPAGETYEYEVDDSVFDPTATGQRDPNVTVEMSEIGEPVFTVLSPNDGSTLLTVTASQLYESEVMPYDDAAEVAMEDAMNSMSASVEKDGYVLNMQGIDDATATFVLVGPDGTELLSGSLDDDGNPSGEGIEILGDPMTPEMRLFDPATGQDYVTFTAMDLADAFMSAATTAIEQVSEPFTVTQDGYTLSGTLPVGEWTVTDAEGTVIATFQSPMLDAYLTLASEDSGADDAVRSVDPLTKDVTVLDNGSPVVTFTYADITAASGDMMDAFASAGEGTIYFSADQGSTWQELSPINGWVSSLAVGDDEVLVTTDVSMAKPLRLPVPSN